MIGDHVRTDNGPEFTSRAFMGWALSHGIRHILIQPGRPMQNGYIESFNGKFRDECFNDHWFQTLHQARAMIATWRRDYNEARPHSSIGRTPPYREYFGLPKVRYCAQPRVLRRSTIRRCLGGEQGKQPRCPIITLAS